MAATRLPLLLMALLAAGCGDHDSARTRPTPWTYAASIGLNEIEVPPGTPPAAVASYTAAWFHWIEARPYGFRWAWWFGEPGASSVSGNVVQGYLVRVAPGPVAFAAPAPPVHWGSQLAAWDLSGPRPVLYLAAGDRGELPGLGHALLHLEVAWGPPGAPDWHHAATSTSTGFPLGWAWGWTWEAAARPPP